MKVVDELDEKEGCSELGTYLKYFSDDTKVIAGIFEKNKIRFTQPWGLNDPMEFNPVIRFNDDHRRRDVFLYNGITLLSEASFYQSQIIEPQINKYGVLSLTKIYDSFSMWSNYANGHKGFLVEFKKDFHKKSCMHQKLLIRHNPKRNQKDSTDYLCEVYYLAVPHNLTNPKVA